ncbi:hypothetical protein CDV31_009186 [Fusarium ambrosium]|uniref:Uncharacterized protein n=1 Tax=Fusarium ambrosium TaxID=131363 RepID=A0A428TWN8_9HYPO|nr:hypothetical protein CDV31_009186 [Fusarium ambrosium]
MRGGDSTFALDTQTQGAISEQTVLPATRKQHPRADLNIGDQSLGTHLSERVAWPGKKHRSTKKLVSISNPLLFHRVDMLH